MVQSWFENELESNQASASRRNELYYQNYSLSKVRKLGFGLEWFLNPKVMIAVL